MPPGDVDPGLQAIERFGLGAVVIVALALFAFALVRWWRADGADQVMDLRHQRDTALAGWQSQTAATERLADVVRDFPDFVRRIEARLDAIERRRR